MIPEPFFMASRAGPATATGGRPPYFLWDRHGFGQQSYNTVGYHETRP